MENDCKNCLICQKKKQKLLEIAERKAKAHAIETQKIMVIYENKNGRYDFLEKEEAEKAGHRPIKFVSFVRQIDDGTVPVLPV